MRLHSPMVRHTGGEWVEIWVPCEHGDLLRDQVHAVLTFKRQGDWWDLRIHDDLIRMHPEGLQAAVVVAVRAMAACALIDGCSSQENGA